MSNQFVTLRIGFGNSADLGNDNFSGIEGAFGGAGNDSIVGNGSNNTLYGGGGDDTLKGDQSVFVGDNSNDQLFGGAGNDSLVGGSGDDTMTGDAGNDIFNYEASSLGLLDVTANGHDVITDGTSGDLISMLGLIDDLQIGGVVLNALSSDAILGGALAVGTSVAFAGGVLQVDVNGDGSFNAADDFQISLTGVTAVTYNATDDSVPPVVVTLGRERGG